MTQSPAVSPANLPRRLERAKADRLKELMKCQPSQKRYRQALRAYLEAENDLQKAIIRRLRLRFH